MKLRNRIIWTFGHGLHSSKRFSGGYETILWFTRSDDDVFNFDVVCISPKYLKKRHFKGPNKGKPSGNPLGKNPSDVWGVLVQDWETLVWNIPNVKSNHPEKTIHPCQFPIELAERCVLALTHEQDWVFDPYMGVGSALVAAVRQGRRAMGCDREAVYVEIARQRLSDYFNDIFGHCPMARSVHQPTGKEKVSQVPEEWKEIPEGQATEVQGEADQ